MDWLLDIIEDKLPYRMDDWDHVQQRNTEACRNKNGEHKCSVDSLKRKFSSLFNNKKPMGDPNCPLEIHHAKRLWKMIQSEMVFLDGKQMINNPLNDSEEDIVIEGGEDEESGVTAMGAAEGVTRAPENGVNRKNGVVTERRSEIAVRSDTTRNAGVKGECLLLFHHSIIYDLHAEDSQQNLEHNTTCRI